MTKPRIGIALCGSYCTYDKLFSQLVLLSDKYELVPIMSETAAATDTRFGKAADFLSRLESLCGTKPVCSIAEAEPLGPAKPMEALIIAPCTGNTMAKLNHGITDTAVTMAAKAHLRNSKPLIIAFSTNDALSGSAPNIAGLLNRKNVYIVPFRQDDPIKKPFSAASDFSLIGATVESALAGKQLQPLLIAHWGSYGYAYCVNPVRNCRQNRVCLALH